MPCRSSAGDGVQHDDKEMGEIGGQQTTRCWHFAALHGLMFLQGFGLKQN